MHAQPTGTGSGDVSAVDWSLTSKRTEIADNTGVSDMGEVLFGELEPGSLVRQGPTQGPKA